MTCWFPCFLIFIFSLFPIYWFSYLIPEFCLRFTVFLLYILKPIVSLWDSGTLELRI